MKITAKMLRKKGASCSSLATFQQEWPDGAEVTLANCQKAAELRLDLNWFGFYFLTASAQRTYGKVIAPALEAFDKAIASAREACDNWEAFYKATAPAREAFDKATAIALYQAWHKREVNKEVLYYARSNQK